MCLALTTARWRLKLKDKAPYLPEACNDEALFRWEGGAGEAAGEPAPDPLERPDILPEEEEPEDGFLPLPFDPFGGAYAPCPCCGADIPDPPSPGFICPVCYWEIDDDVRDNPIKPSGQNHGLSLDEARMNFRAFGICDPSLCWHEPSDA